MKNNYFFFLFLFTMSMTHGMQLDDFYENKESVPMLHTYKEIRDITKHSKETMPFIENFGAINTTDEQNSFSIELLTYDASSLGREVQHNKVWNIFTQDQSVVNTILANPHKIVITQKQNGDDFKKTVFIPIEFQSDHTTREKDSRLLLLALVAGKKHFKINNATVTIKNDDMEIWQRLFKGYQTLIKLKTEYHITYGFNLNFKVIDANRNAIQNILILVHSIRKNFDVESTTNRILKDETKKINKLNYFLLMGEEQERRAPKFSIFLYYGMIKRKLSQKFLQPIKRWFDYFYDSYRFWFG